MPNMALNRAPFGRRTLRDKAAQRRLALLLSACIEKRMMRNAASECANRRRWRDDRMTE